MTLSGSVRGSTVRPVSFRKVLSAERIKLFTLPSYVLSFGIGFIVLAGFGTLSAYAAIIQRNDPNPTVIAEPGAMLTGIQGVQLLLIFLAVVFTTSEFTQHTIQPTYLSVPTRLPVLASKTLLIASLAFVIGAAGAAVALLSAGIVLDSAGIPFSVESERAVRLVIGTGLYLAAVSVIGLGIGMLVRSTVGALLTALILISVLPLILGSAPFEWLREAAPYLPSTAGLLILRPDGQTGSLGPWEGLAVAGAWAIASFITASIVMRRTDA